MVCKGVKKNGEPCTYSNCGQNFYCKIHKSQNKGILCTICHEDITPNKAGVTGCNHTFHHSCLEQWRNTKHGDTCPNCRSHIPKMSSDKIVYYIKTTIEKLDYINNNYEAIVSSRDMFFETIKSNCDFLIEMSGDIIKEKPCNKDKEILNKCYDKLHKLQVLYYNLHM